MEELLTLARAPWCPANAHLFPRTVREIYVMVARLVYATSHVPGAYALMEVWVQRVLPMAFVRSQV